MKRITLGILVLVLGAGLMAELATAVAAAGQGQDAGRLLRAAMNTEMVDGNLTAAIEQYKRVAASGDRALAAQALVRMAECYQKLGDAQAQAVYERLLRDYADQREPATLVRTRLAAMRPSPTLPSGKTARQIWMGTGVDGLGAPSADGRYLTFTDWETGDLAIRDLITGTNRRLTRTGGWVASGDYASGSVMSPDGRHVAYAWFVEKEFKNELRVIGATPGTTSPTRTLIRTERPDFLKPVAWTRDGQRVIVVRSQADHTNQIGTIALRDGSFQSIKSLDWRYPDRVSLSPNGQLLAYDVPAGDNGSPRDIVVLATDGSRETTVVQGPANDTAPAWSPDGTQLLFLSDRTGSVSVWSQAFSAGAGQGPPVMVKADIGRVSVLGISGSGALYYYVGGSSRRNVYVADVQANRVTRSPALATENSVNANVGPTWSRDGQYLAYYSFRSPTMLVVRTVATGAERAVPVPASLATPFNSGPKWFPDNRSVLILARDAQGSGFGFHRLALDSGKTDLLWQVSPEPSSFDLSPDGTTIFAAFQNDNQPRQSPAGTGRIARYDIENRSETILKEREWFITLAVSHDGAQLAYIKTIRKNTTEYASALEVMSTGGGPSRTVYRDAVWLAGDRDNALTWTPDQKSLLFIRSTQDNQNILWTVPAASGPPERAGISMDARLKSLSISPDGRRLAFGAIEADANEVWVLEHFLPPQTARR